MTTQSIPDRSSSTQGRIRTIDLARFYGIVLVYYGHIVEQVMYTGSAEAAAQYKFIYSFHMPLFFFLSGTIVSERKLRLPFIQFFRRTLASRLIPYVFFSILMATASLFLPGWFPLGALTDAGAYLKSTIATLMGFPAFCIPLWFMALLISVEVFHALVARIIKHPAILGLTAVLLYIGGYYLNDAYNFVANQQAFWFINEVPVVYLFYVAGILLKKSELLTREYPKKWAITAALACLVLVVATYDMNTGPFRIIQAVVIVLSGHGNIVLFPLTAFIGSLFILFAAAASPAWTWLSYMGKNALSLFCLNGLFYHFVNPFAGKWFAHTFEVSQITVFSYSTIMTILSLMICLPITFFLTTYIPQLMGKPAQEGPLLAPLINSKP